ncbi:MAG: L,D-transpeptidase family protein [Burkholderiales bacterium]
MPRIRISVPKQSLELFDDAGRLIRKYSVSTSKNGVGEQCDSDCTPRGKHIIRAKIGAGLPLNSVFVSRRPTGDIYTSELGELHPGRDWILTRVLWLSGCEPGVNRLREVDTMRRMVYIHGTSDEQGIGQPLSHGCIRMRNRDVVELFDQVAPGTPVDILET